MATRTITDAVCMSGRAGWRGATGVDMEDAQESERLPNGQPSDSRVRGHCYSPRFGGLRYRRDELRTATSVTGGRAMNGQRGTAICGPTLDRMRKTEKKGPHPLTPVPVSHQARGRGQQHENVQPTMRGLPYRGCGSHRGERRPAAEGAVDAPLATSPTDSPVCATSAVCHT